MFEIQKTRVWVSYIKLCKQYIELPYFIYLRVKGQGCVVLCQFYLSNVGDLDESNVWFGLVYGV